MEKKAIIIVIVLVLLVILQKKCDFLSTCDAQISYADIDLNKDIDFDSLFAPISQQEKAEVWQEWGNLDLAPKQVVKLMSGVGVGACRINTVSHMVGENTHYGAIITPSNMEDSLKYPILIVASGLNQKKPEVHLQNSTLNYLSQKLGQQYIIVFPSFRGQSLKHAMYNYCSEGFFGDAFDGATDDAIALLNVALELYPQADSSRVVAFGGSRGGTVSLLLGIRDERVKRVIAQAAPTDFFTRRMSERFSWQYKYQFLSKPEPLATIRKKIIKSSPIHFAEFLPEIWVDSRRKRPNCLS